MPDAENAMEQRIRERAFELWIEAGSPEGDGQEFWYAAERVVAQKGAVLDTGEAGRSSQAGPTATRTDVALPAPVPPMTTQPPRRAP